MPPRGQPQGSPQEPGHPLGKGGAWGTPGALLGPAEVLFLKLSVGYTDVFTRCRPRAGHLGPVFSSVWNKSS